jgi:5-methylcytosine-specific restriction endonuclease McrA
VRAALRQVWLRSRERAAALRRETYHCERCGAKGSAAKGREVKLEVHHREGIDWDGVIDLVIERIMVDPSRLEVLCEDCHDKEHGE